MISRLLIRGLVFVVVLLFVEPVAAHSGSAHASPLHWVFLVLILSGGVVMGSSVFLGQRLWSDYPEGPSAGF